MKTLKTTDPLCLTYGNSKDGRIFNSWRIYNREGNKLRTLATMESDAMSPEREHELARLFCAASDLLGALQNIVANPDMADGEEPRRLIAAARAAIAKATGATR